MLTASSRALWPFFVRFSAPSPAWIARARARLQINLPLQCNYWVHIQCDWAARLVFCRRLLDSMSSSIMQHVFHEFAGSIPGGRAAAPAGAGLFFVFPLGFFQENLSTTLTVSYRSRRLAAAGT